MTSPKNSADALSGNPCPFLRALVEEGTISNDVVPLAQVSAIAKRAFPPTETKPIAKAVTLIAAIGNGLNPSRLARNVREGLHPGELRGGPLDKRGAGSRILNVRGVFDASEFERLNEFAADFRDEATGTVERGLGVAQLEAMMDANFERAAGQRRRIDRRLMNGEWPVLLRVMGKPSSDGPYLSLAELRTLFESRRLPHRVSQRI